jgi:acetyltransferase
MMLASLLTRCVRTGEIVMERLMVDSFETKNGLSVRVRPLLRQDTPHLVDLFDHMSADSRYSRFHQPLQNVAPERVWTEAKNIAHTEPQIGFIAFADLPDQPDAPIGVARCVCLGNGVAETAVSVRDDMQNQGIATRLVNIMAEEAKKQGISKLVATIQNSNKAILYVLNRLPHPYTCHRVGAEIELELDLTKINVKHET